MIIAVDFDGTCVTHDFPVVGTEIGAWPVLKRLTDAGHQVILWTMRCDNPEKEQKFLSDAVWWFEQHGIPLYGSNKNPDQAWTHSPKVYAHMYIDDAALGIPLKVDEHISPRPFVDWVAVEKLLEERGCFPAPVTMPSKGWDIPEQELQTERA